VRTRIGSPRKSISLLKIMSISARPESCSTSTRQARSPAPGFALMKRPARASSPCDRQFMLDTHTQEHGYTEIYAPYLVNARAWKEPDNCPSSRPDLFAVPRARRVSSI